MIRPLSARERKLVAIALLIAVIAAIQLIVVGPILSGFAEREALRATLTQRYAYNERLIASVPRFRRQAETQRRQVRAFVIGARDEAHANAQLTERLRDTVGTAGGEFLASELPTAAAGTARVAVTMRMTLDQLVALLDRLQNDRPLLVIESLNVAADQALVDGALTPLDIRLEVSIPFVPTA